MIGLFVSFSETFINTEEVEKSIDLELERH